MTQAPIQHPLAASRDIVFEAQKSLFSFLWRQKKWLALAALAGLLLGVLLALLLPQQFKSQLRFLPPQSNSGGAAVLLSQFGGGAMGGAAMSALGVKSPGDLYIGLLKSRTVADAILDKFGLMQKWKLNKRSDAYKKLQKISSFTSGKDGILQVEVEMADPALAQHIAAEYYAQLQSLQSRLALTEASQRRRFFEKELGHAKEQLVQKELDLKRVQQQTGVVQLADQTRASIESIARLRAQVSAKEVEIASIRAYAADSNPDLRRAEAELAALRNELAKATAGSTEAGSNLIGTARLPELGLDYARRFRDFKYAESIYELLLKQYEVARLDEAKDASTLQLLDPANLPDVRSKPNRPLVLIISMVLSLLGVAAWLLWRYRAQWLSDLRARMAQAPQPL